ncbi:MAG: methionine adenosyltransferase [Chloroflexi bacterium]|nr:methionine adenosyltransferase [Chloroflexota bacterium]MBT7080848.1 methionine adenosyltransferase [Chloroflexota bacterium]MBT7289705.1 methionine adenosyltransferase [Chloroflexota bacterium]
MKAKQMLVTSESVTEGHPDKICDQISDAVLDSILAQDPMARVACETMATTGLVVIAGEITTDCYVEFPDVVRKTIREIGYTRAKYGFDCDTCGVMVAVHGQSPDIAMGVDEALEKREGDKDELDSQGAGDQGMMVGFACNETEELMPLTMSLAHKLTKQLATVRKDRSLHYLRPDGKSQVTVEYSHGIPQRVSSVCIGTQHDSAVSNEVIRRDVIENVIREIVPHNLLDNDTTYYVNGTGRFVVGGPMGDCGLTGRKILVDTYGGIARHGGGAFSGKDPTKVDRSAAYAARYAAKNVVAAGLADRLEIILGYVIGVAHPVSVTVESFGTAKVDEDLIVKLVNKHFDFRPAAIVRDLDLRRPIYRQTAAYGHFGRTDIDLPWEATDKADALRDDAGLKPKK